jgi:hypothetical protein
MSERRTKSGSRLLRTFVAFNLLAYSPIIFAGDSVTSENTYTYRVPDNPNTPRRCYEKPRPSMQSGSDVGPLRLTGKEVFDQDPLNSYEIVKKAIGALVSIRRPTGPTSGIEASGYLAEDPSGNQVAITAAHAVRTTDVTTIEITNNVGDKTTAISSCYLFEGRGRFVDLNIGQPESNHAPVDIDVAVLRLAKPLGKATLDLSAESPQRGEWGLFTSFPGGEARFYHGLAANPGNSNIYLTGVEPWRRVRGAADYTLQFGDSGGPVLSDAATVEGIAVGRYDNGVTPDELYKEHKVYSDIPIGEESGFVPLVAGVVDRRHIAAALNSSAY